MTSISLISTGRKRTRALSKNEIELIATDLSTDPKASIHNLHKLNFPYSLVNKDDELGWHISKKQKTVQSEEDGKDVEDASPSSSQEDPDKLPTGNLKQNAKYVWLIEL